MDLSWLSHGSHRTSNFNRGNTMIKVVIVKAVIVILYTLLPAASAMAAQVCRGSIPQTTPTADFIDHGDGTLTHKQTGLMWKKCVQGLSGVACTTGLVSAHTWQAALQLAGGHSFAGYSDWRLPNIKELASIVEMSCSLPAINLGVFPNDPSSNVWSGSPHATKANDAWTVNFGFGRHYSGYRNHSTRVRLVRGGQ